MARWEEDGWQEEDLNKLKLGFLNNMLSCKESQGVDVTVYFAKYLNMVGVNPDNYPIFLDLFRKRNHWVVDALIGDIDPRAVFKDVQPNYFILAECFKAFEEAGRGGMYPKSLLVFLGILEVTYKNPLEGYRVFPLNAENVNNLGKHLDEEKDQMDPLNRSILMILDKIASLMDPGTLEDEDIEVMKVATQANNIRGKFLDMTKHLNEALPELLLKKDDYSTDEIPPTQS